MELETTEFNYEERLSEWWDQYKPISNHIVNNGCLFETYGAELEFVKAQDSKHIWTLVEGDSGDLYIENGFHYVNRLNYLITELPFEGDECCVTYMMFDNEEDDWVQCLKCEHEWIESTEYLQVCPKCGNDNTEMTVYFQNDKDEEDRECY
jgi:hypothetical protein